MKFTPTRVWRSNIISNRQCKKKSWNCLPEKGDGERDKVTSFKVRNTNLVVAPFCSFTNFVGERIVAAECKLCRWHVQRAHHWTSRCWEVAGIPILQLLLRKSLEGLSKYPLIATFSNNLCLLSNSCNSSISDTGACFHWFKGDVNLANASRNFLFSRMENKTIEVERELEETYSAATYFQQDPEPY